VCSMRCWNCYLSVLERYRLLAAMISSPLQQGEDLCTPTVLTTSEGEKEVGIQRRHGGQRGGTKARETRE